MSEPISTSTGADADSGTAPKKGAKKSERTNIPAAVTAVSPVRPPSRIPAVHSTAMMMGEQPVAAAIMVPMAEAMSAQTPPGTASSPTPRMSPAFMESPMRHPEQSKSATSRKVSTPGTCGRGSCLVSTGGGGTRRVRIVRGGGRKGWVEV